MFLCSVTTALVPARAGRALVAGVVQSGPVIKLAGAVGVAAAGYHLYKRSRALVSQSVNFVSRIPSGPIRPAPPVGKSFSRRENLSSRRYTYSHSRRRSYLRGPYRR